jgi:predicted lysophospholipase L1 biosynthesis ABC-type transport system permease subunit
MLLLDSSSTTAASRASRSWLLEAMVLLLAFVPLLQLAAMASTAVRAVAASAVELAVGVPAAAAAWKLHALSREFCVAWKRWLRKALGPAGTAPGRCVPPCKASHVVP